MHDLEGHYSTNQHVINNIIVPTSPSKMVEGSSNFSYLLTYPNIAPTAPTNVIATAVDSTHVTVEWSESDTPNGIVRQYIISYNQSGSDAITVNGTNRTVTIGDLLPFTFYEFTVVAVTVTAGPGDSDTVQTHEAGLCMCTQT